MFWRMGTPTRFSIGKHCRQYSRLAMSWMGAWIQKNVAQTKTAQDAAESLEKAAHPQHIGGQTFFDAQEGETLPL